MKQWIILVIVMAIFIWFGWLCSGWYINALKHSGGLIWARDIIGARAAGVILGGIVGFFLGLFLAEKFDP